MPLTQAKITALTSARQTGIDNPSITNIVAYYTVLEGAGIAYGALAKGVLLDNTFAGIVANNYLENKVVHEKGGVFGAENALALMRDSWM